MHIDEGLVERARGIAPLIRECREAIDRERHLPAELVGAMADAGLFMMYVPKELGGLETTPATFMRVVETVAQADGSAGWNAAICGVQGVYLSRLQPGAAKQVLASGTSGIAGSFNPAEGRMVTAAGGYAVTGRWRFASGCDHAAWMMAPGIVTGGSGAVVTADGRPVTRIGLLPKEECTVIDTWRVGGLRGTGSHDFMCERAFIAQEMTFDAGDPGLYPGPLYRIPVLTAFGPGVASVCLGIARGAANELRRLASEKRPLLMQGLLRERGAVQLQMAEVEALVQSARAFLVQGIEAVWRCAEEGRTVGQEERALQRLAAWNAARSAVRAVRLVHEAAGTSALYEENPIERAFRDVHAARQHATVSAAVQEALGRVFLGMEPGNPLV